MFAEMLERIVTDNKRYHLMGAFLLDKEIRSKIIREKLIVFFKGFWVVYLIEFNMLFNKSRFDNVLLECNSS